MEFNKNWLKEKLEKYKNDKGFIIEQAFLEFEETLAKNQIKLSYKGDLNHELEKDFEDLLSELGYIRLSATMSQDWVRSIIFIYK